MIRHRIRAQRPKLPIQGKGLLSKLSCVFSPRVLLFFMPWKAKKLKNIRPSSVLHTEEGNEIRRFDHPHASQQLGLVTLGKIQFEKSSSIWHRGTDSTSHHFK